MKVCGCGHDLGKHPDRGPCVVCARSATPDKCPGYHSRRSGRRIFTTPSEEPLLHQPALERIAHALERIAAVLERGATLSASKPVRPVLAPAPVKPPAPARSRVGTSGNLPGGHRRILLALARYGQCSRPKLAILAVYAARGGSFNNYLSALRTAGHILGEGQGPYEITSAGLGVLGDFEPLPVGADKLFADWLQHPELGKAHREIMRVLRQAQGRSMTKDVIAEMCVPRYEPGGGSFNNAVSRLRVLGIVEGKNEIRLTEQLRP